MRKLLVALVVLCLFTLTACADVSTLASTESKAPGQAVPSSASSAGPLKAPESQAEAKAVYEDKLISVWFIKKYDISYMPSMFYFDIKVDNKTDQKISVYPDDAYVNSTTFSVYSGEPMDIQPKTNRTHTFFGQYEGTGIKSSSQITKLGFKLYLMDENTHDIETTKTIEVKF
jgi:hypothetical protein